MDNINMTPTSREMMLYFHIFILSVVLLLVLIPLMRRHFATRSNFGHTLFKAMIYLDIVVLALDMFTWWIFGKDFAGAVALHKISMALYYSVEAWIFYVWILYSVYKLYRSKRIVMKRAPLYAILPISFEIVVIINLFTGSLFEINARNNYIRGSGYFLVFVYSIVVVVSIVFEVIHYLKKYADSHNKELYMHLLVIPIAMTVFRFIQFINYGAFLTWPAFTVGLVYLYMYMQANENYFDYLTGLRNRRETDYYLNYKIKTRKKDSVLFVVYLDLNFFKNINDNFGHHVGDDAIQSAASILKTVCKGSDDFISRVGGDEFAIVGERWDKSAVHTLIEQIDLATIEFNRLEEKPYDISFSYGISVYEEGMTKDELFIKADEEMYKQKKINKD